MTSRVSVFLHALGIQPRTERRARILPVALFVCWVAALGVLFGGLWSYGLTAGPTAANVPTWPTQTALVRRPGKPTLLMFAHPMCACTRASVATLHAILGERPGAIDGHIVVHAAAQELGRFGGTIPAAALTALSVRIDPDPTGREARIFGARTSGHVVLYDARGSLRFAGGITSARGHALDTSSLRALVRLMTRRNRNTAMLATARTYGCELAENHGAEP